jgi:hypothetical protein
MNKKLLFISLIITIVVIALGFFIVKYYYYPFGAPPKGTSPNCGPEERYRFDVTIDSKEDFVDFLKTHEINQWVSLDNFKNITRAMRYEDIKSAEVDWNKVLSEVQTENAGFKTIYVLDYNPFTCSGFTLKMSADGYVSVYGCCGD